VATDAIAAASNEKVLTDAIVELGQRVAALETGRLVDVETQQKLNSMEHDLKSMLEKLTILHQRVLAVRNKPPDPTVN
jgi:hypothetical protein